jgi:pyruvate dehydrogenase E2 component (dihydrolipoamide acetyltransferase)
MAEIVRMPKLSDTMTEGVVATWLKQVGDEVESGEILAEIETDKATMEFESFFDGVLLHIGVEQGSTAPVDSLLCILGEKGEDISAVLKDAESAAVVEEASTPTPAPAPVATPTPAPPPVAAAPAPVAPTAVTPAPAPLTPASNGRLKASPLARKLAEERGLNVAHIPGSGDSGRVVKRDVEAFQASGAGMPVTGVERFTEVGISQMRKTIARRLSESKFSAPHFYLTVSINMDEAMATRKAINDGGEVKISFNDMVVKAAALALKKHPVVNSSWLGDRIRFNEHVHIGVAVSVDEGLLVPVVRHADLKRMSQIGAEVKDFAGKARDKKLQPSDWEGNTFTISNLGMFGIDEFTAIINAPDSCILAVGGINAVPVVKNGAVVPGHVMKVTLSCDHRSVDGASGAAFLQDFRAYLENPVRMLANGF